VLGAHGFSLTTSFHPSLENTENTTEDLRVFIEAKESKEKIFSERSTQVRSKSPVAPLLVSVVPPDDLGVKFTRTVSLMDDHEKLNNEAKFGRERTNNRNENEVPTSVVTTFNGRYLHEFPSNFDETRNHS
jgi:hypothetical protein